MPIEHIPPKGENLTGQTINSKQSIQQKTSMEEVCHDNKKSVFGGVQRLRNILPGRIMIKRYSCTGSKSACQSALCLMIAIDVLELVIKVEFSSSGLELVFAISGIAAD